MTNSKYNNNFSQFWLEYLHEHDTRASRACHYIGTTLSITATALLLRAGMVFFLPLALIPAYLAAALGHRLGLRTAQTATEAPVWSILADLRMFGLFLTGRLRHELERAG